MGKVKSDLDSLKEKSGSAGSAMKGSMTDSRESVMLLSDEIGVHMPRALSMYVSKLPGVGAALEAAFPILGIVAVIDIVSKLIEKHEKLKETLSATALAQGEAGVKGQMAMNALDDKLLQVQKRTEELTGDKLGALKTELELINQQSLDDLIANFEKFGADAKGVFDNLTAATSGFHLWETGVKGVTSAYDNFKVKYEQLLSTAKETNDNEQQAENLRLGTLQSANAVLNAQIELANKKKGIALDLKKGQQDELLLQKAGISYSEQDIAAQQQFVNVLNETGQAKQKIADIKSGETKNAGLSTHISMLSDEANMQKLVAQGVKQEADAQAMLNKLKADASLVDSKGKNEADLNTNAQNAIQRIRNQAEYEKAIAQDTLKAKLAELNAEQSAQVEGNAKWKELEQEKVNANKAYADAIAITDQKAANDSVAATARATEAIEAYHEQLADSVTAMDRAYAVQKSSAALTAIKKEEDADANRFALGLETAKQELANRLRYIEAERDAKLKAIQDEIRFQDEAATRAGLAGDTVKQNNELAKKIQLQTQLNNLTAQYGSEINKVNTDAMKLNSSWATYFAKMKAETMDLSTTVRTQLQTSMTQAMDGFSNSVAKSIIEGKSLGASMRQVAIQITESWIEMCIKKMLMDRMTTVFHIAGNETQVASDKTANMQSQLSSAKAAAAKAYQAMSGIPVIGPELGAVAAAAVFAGAMAFETGGKIPGEGAVPIIGHGGETVVQKVLTDRVERAERNGGTGNGQMHMHYSPQIHAIDSTGVDAMLKEHGQVFQRHVTQAIRKANR